MTLRVKVVPGSSRSVVEEGPEGLKVRVKSPPTRGKANRELRKVLAREYGVAVSDIEILKGHKSRVKYVKIIGKQGK